MFLTMITRFFAGQYGKPRGWFGRRIGEGMAERNVYDARWTVSLLDIQPHDRVLEIGFGPGVSTRLAATKATDGLVIGLDHSQAMVEAARQDIFAYIEGFCNRRRRHSAVGNVSPIEFEKEHVLRFN